MSGLGSFKVRLPSALRRFVEQGVDSGRYQSPDELIGESLRLLQHEEERRSAAIDSLRKMVELGAAQADRGELVDGDEVFREWRSRDASARRRKKTA